MLVLERCVPVENKVLTGDGVRLYMDHILDSLDVLHQNRVLHHDVHPENIMYSKARKRYVLLDFGVSTVGFMENPTDKVFYEMREDHFSLLQSVVLSIRPKWRVLDNDYRRWRKRWARYFDAHPGEWDPFRERFRRWLPRNTPHLTLFQRRILRLDTPLLPAGASEEQATRVKIMLTRFHLLFCVLVLLPARYRQKLAPCVERLCFFL